MRTRWLTTTVLAAALAVTGAVLHASAANAESNGGVRVMPLGDSITEGTQVPGGYRIGLWQRMAAAGYRVDLVGSQFNGPSGLGDHDHEGHPGWRIDQIDANIVGWLNTYQPHTVLLHIGTNDVLQNYNLSGAPGRLSALIDHITAAAPAAEVFVATIIPLSNSGQEAAGRTFNAAVPGIVQSKANAGKHVHLVDMHSALTTGDLTDGIHPTATGYDKMAAAWYAALLSVSGSIGTGSSSSASELVGAASGRCLDVPGGNTANGTQPIIWDCHGRPTSSGRSPARPCRPWASAWTRRWARARDRRCRSGTATVDRTSAGLSTPTRRSAASRRGCAWTCPGPRPPTAPWPSCGPAPPRPTSAGPGCRPDCPFRRRPP